MVLCSRFSDFLEKKMEEKRFNIVFKLNTLDGYHTDNVLDKIKNLNLNISLMTEVQAILLNLDQGYTVIDFAEALKENIASGITPPQVLEILEELERHNVVFRA